MTIIKRPPRLLGMTNVNSPAGIAAVIAAALAEHGVQVGRPNADSEAGGHGFVDVRTPDGETYRIKIEGGY